MNQYVQTTRNYIVTHKKAFLIGGAWLAGIAILIALFVYNNPSVVVYQPSDACKMFTPSEAQDLLGDKVINVNTNKITVSGNIAVSKCSYTDSNPDQTKMIVAAIAVRSGVNDKGVAQNKTEFAASQANNTAQIVKDLGDKAWFNQVSGQLNVLSGKRWIIISYGAGASPADNTVDKAVELAHKIL